MNTHKLQATRISNLLPKIARGLQITPLIDEVKPGLTTSQLMVLLILKEMKGIAVPVGKLAQELAVSFPAASGIIDRLQKAHMIKRDHSKKDRRVVLVKLTEEGERIVDTSLRTLEHLLSRIFETLPRTERQSIMNAIEKVAEFSKALSGTHANTHSYQEQT